MNGRNSLFHDSSFYQFDAPRAAKAGFIRELIGYSFMVAGIVSFFVVAIFA